MKTGLLIIFTACVVSFGAIADETLSEFTNKYEDTPLNVAIEVIAEIENLTLADRDQYSEIVNGTYEGNSVLDAIAKVAASKGYSVQSDGSIITLTRE